jgi:DNA replication and repair protein RecF
LRRDYLDDLAAQLKPQAVADQAEYAKALRQRNALLRQYGRDVDVTTLSVWDERLAESGARLMTTRRRVMEDLDPHLGETYRLVGGSGNLTWSYRARWVNDSGASEASLAESLLDALTTRHQRDMETRTTGSGPHRDDPALVLDGRDARTRASQGEQRTTALALRIGAHRLISSLTATAPVLLLDDVFSELDVGRARRVIDLLAGGQVLVTSARDDDVPLPGRRWRVEKGAVT